MSALQPVLGIVLLAVGGGMVFAGRARNGATVPFLRNDLVAMAYLLLCLLVLVAGAAIMIAHVLG